ncbi:MAG TPA: helix-turn-helix domain-containing protein [Bacteroidia bacterium]
MNIELAEDIILIFGEKNIIKVYKLVGNEKVSFARLIKMMQNKKIVKQLNASGYQCIAAIVKEFKISRRTVYRILNKLYKKK